jgi:hypothetical protein
MPSGACPPPFGTLNLSETLAGKPLARPRGSSSFSPIVGSLIELHDHAGVIVGYRKGVRCPTPIAVAIFCTVRPRLRSSLARSIHARGPGYPDANVAELAYRLSAIRTTLGRSGPPESPDVQDIAKSLRQRSQIPFSRE